MYVIIDPLADANCVRVVLGNVINTVSPLMSVFSK